MKQDILLKIYEKFDKWAGDLTPACRRGCALCCTKNVLVSGLEAEALLHHALAAGLAPEIGRRLSVPLTHGQPSMTTNEFAAACLDGLDADPGGQENPEPCPFLDQGSCLVYAARPFGCRLFISERRCSPGQPALVPDHYFEGATAVSQLIEHLGQGEYWGNLVDVLLALLDSSAFRDVADRVGPSLSLPGRQRCRTARPRPGFLLSEAHGERVGALLQAIFDTRVQGRRIEDTLNGR